MLHLLRNVVEEVNSTRDLQTSLRTVVGRIREGMDVQVCSVFLWDPHVNRYVLMATDGLSPDAIGKVTLTQNQGLVALVGKREEPLNLSDATQHPNFFPVAGLGEEPYKGMLGVPIIHHRKLLGVLTIQKTDAGRFGDAEEAVMVTISAQLAGVLAHAEATGALSGLNLLGGEQQDVRFNGVAGAQGVAIGQAHVLLPPADLDAVPVRRTDDIEAEVKLFHDALASVRSDLRATSDRLKNELRPEELALFNVYVGILEDAALGDAVIERVRKGEWAQSALAEVMRGYIDHFDSMDDAYLRERASDMRDLGRRVLSYLQESVPETVLPENAILVGEEISPTVFGEMADGKIAGIVCTQGSANSHVAILARALDIPTVMGVQELPWQALQGEELVVDGYRGHLYYRLSQEKRRYFENIVEEEAEREAGLEALKDVPSETQDGVNISLLVNTGLQTDVIRSQDRGADGVGLFRTEVPFMLRERFPSEEEQALIYRAQLQAFSPLPVTMRTLDVGGDKSLAYFPIVEDNPFLGWRGLRVMLDHPELFMVQIRAMLRASVNLNNLKIMLPMVTSVSEVEESLALIHRAVMELNEEGVNAQVPHIGVMVEVPSAVYLVREFASQVDFISVGSNDLTQYLLAVDRNNPRVAGIYDAMHPAVLKALKMVVDAGNEANVPVSLCGELAGDPLGAVTLVGLGYRQLSMSSSNLLRVKAVLRQIDSGWAQTVASGLLHLDNPRVVRSTLRLALRKAGVPMADLGMLPS
ncbi:phosphoenolpyruvate--protein phosphotransferase [Saccharospirillum salsuginis]|uniref:phosphoenolpyruvate--protein phosphotransferase n=1 Tax=Saccharospirillum salsuginis TaxID=418750 RepID=A0A918N8K2_9GAMM|nr:phosphoenolpyruvate--protein phosphotransferase [Saccharospirillum salsuginis]GGX54080.1 phosphoenolpyruvate-protein phosphotransferase PtsP [Saccharospirillum salsuginis]